MVCLHSSRFRITPNPPPLHNACWGERVHASDVRPSSVDLRCRNTALLVPRALPSLPSSPPLPSQGAMPTPAPVQMSEASGEQVGSAGVDQTAVSQPTVMTGVSSVHTLPFFLHIRRPFSSTRLRLCRPFPSSLNTALRVVALCHPLPFHFGGLPPTRTRRQCTHRRTKGGTENTEKKTVRRRRLRKTRGTLQRRRCERQ